jgi:hypothetical protein
MLKGIWNVMRDAPVVMRVWFVMHDVIRETVSARSLGMLVVGWLAPALARGAYTGKQERGQAALPDL